MENLKEAFIRMIQIPSVTASASEKEAVYYLERILNAEGIRTERIYKDPERVNLLACLPADYTEDSTEDHTENRTGDYTLSYAGNQSKEGPLVLISHVDVVDGDAEKWDYPVFGGVEADGRIYGRGTLDTKHLTMMELGAFLYLKHSGKKLRRDVYFLATIDEEEGSSYGMEYVKQERPEIFKNSMVINEGGGFPLRIHGCDYLMVTVGEKAVCKVRLTARGQGGHASAPGSDQALLKLAAVLEDIFASEGELTFGSHATRDAMTEIMGGGEPDNPVAADIYGYAGQNSIGMRDYQMGDRSNSLPSTAEVVLEFKVLPETREEEIEEFVKRRLRDGVEYEIISFEKGFESNFGNSALRKQMERLKTICWEEGFACEVLPMLALGRTDGRFFGSEDSVVYGCSPLLMEDSFDVVLPKVHGNNESITAASFDFGARVLKRFIEENCV